VQKEMKHTVSDHCVEQVFYLPFNTWNTKQVNWYFKTYSIFHIYNFIC